MSQHDFTIANQSSSAARTDINDALQALASTSSGAASPATTYAGQLWYDSSNNWLRLRNEANSGWKRLFYIDDAKDSGLPFNGASVVGTSGNVVGTLGIQNTSTWEAGTDTSETLVSPEKVRASADEAILDTQALNSVGSYAFLRQNTTNVARAAGGARPGSTLRYSNADGTNSGGTPGGTWRLMGDIPASTNLAKNVSVWVRIS
jgi:hypothetical protein